MQLQYTKSLLLFPLCLSAGSRCRLDNVVGRYAHRCHNSTCALHSRMEIIGEHAHTGGSVHSRECVSELVAMPETSSASGGNDSSTRWRASSRAIIASSGLSAFVLSFVSKVRAETLSLLALNTIRCCFHSADHSTMATKIAKPSQIC